MSRFLARSVRMLAFSVCLLLPLRAQKAAIETILQVKRIYVSPLEGGQAAALRELIIAGLNSTRLFILTDNPERADAVLKGAAEDTSFTDTFDSSDSASGHENVSKTNGSSSLYARGAGIALGNGGSMNESHHIKERKHEAYAAVRLCNKEGDVLWSTTQESLGAKFKGAGADVAARVAHQLTLDYERERRLAHPDEITAPVRPGVLVK